MAAYRDKPAETKLKDIHMLLHVMGGGKKSEVPPIDDDKKWPFKNLPNKKWAYKTWPIHFVTDTNWPYEEKNWSCNVTWNFTDCITK